MHAYERSARKTASEATPYGCRKKSARGRPAPLIVFRLFFTMIGRDRMQALAAVNGPPPNTASDNGARRNSGLSQRRRQATGGRSDSLVRLGQSRLSQDREVPIASRAKATPSREHTNERDTQRRGIAIAAPPDQS